MNERCQPAAASPKQENVGINLLCNAILPGFLLSYLSEERRLGPVWGLVVSLSIPLGYGVWDLWTWRRMNVISIIGVAGTLLTGALGPLKTGGFWIAVKEAAVPAILGLAIPMTLRTKQPLVRTLLYNDSVLDTQRIHSALEVRRNVSAFDNLLNSVSWVLAASLLLSAVLNFGLARWLLTAPPGTPEFNAQLGKMNWLSWPVIMLPSTAITFYALFALMRGVETLTGLDRDELFRHQPAKVRSLGAATPSAIPPAESEG